MRDQVAFYFVGGQQSGQAPQQAGRRAGASNSSGNATAPYEGIWVADVSNV